MEIRGGIEAALSERAGRTAIRTSGRKKKEERREKIRRRRAKEGGIRKNKRLKIRNLR